MKHCNALAAALTVAGLSACAQVTVTSNNLLNGIARVADTTTNAVAGTSNATTDTTRDIDASTHQARLAFVRSQLVLLRREAAAGEGEHLRALARLMGEPDPQAFARALQAHYAAIFVARSNPEQVLQNLYRVVGLPADMRRS